MVCVGFAGYNQPNQGWGFADVMRGVRNLLSCTVVLYFSERFRVQITLVGYASCIHHKVSALSCGCIPPGTMPPRNSRRVGSASRRNTMGGEC